MEYLGKFIAVIYEHMKTEFEVYGYTFSFWHIYMFTIVATILCFIIGEIFDIGD